jgi:hypothetical protein
MEGRQTIEQLNERFPDMVGALANHPGVGLLLIRSGDHGALVLGPNGIRHLADGTVEGEDPLEPYGEAAERSLARLDAMPNCGDLALVSALDPDTLQVSAFEELIGSHGGLGGAQTQALLLYPADWKLDSDIVGADAVHEQLRTWMKMATADNAIVDPDELVEAAPTVTATA